MPHAHAARVVARGCEGAQKVIDHYENPRNVGSMDKNDSSVGSGAWMSSVGLARTRAHLSLAMHTMCMPSDASPPGGAIGLRVEGLGLGLCILLVAKCWSSRRPRCDEGGVCCTLQGRCVRVVAGGSGGDGDGEGDGGALWRHAQGWWVLRRAVT